MANVLSPLKLYRKNFGKIERIVDISNLIEMQKESYRRFLQKDLPPEARSEYGLHGVFKSVFPIKDFSGACSLEFVEYGLGDPKYDVDECQQRGMTFEVPMKIRVRLVVYETGTEVKSQTVRDIKEQEIYFGTLPLMTENGTFIINGTERVVVSQLHRSPGLFIDHDRAKIHSSGKIIYSARLIPLRGSWIDFEFDPKDILYVRIDRRRKFPATILLKALGYSTEELLNFFYKTERIGLAEDGIHPAVGSGDFAGQDHHHRHPGPQERRGRGQEDEAADAGAAAKAGEGRGDRHSLGGDGTGRPGGGPRHPGPGERRSHSDVQRGPGRGQDRPVAGEGHQGDRSAVHRRGQRQPVPAEHAVRRQDRQCQGRHPGDLSAAAAQQPAQ